MMESPGLYAQLHICGKNTDQIMKEICRLKRQINRLTRVLENPEYVPTMDPSEDVQLSYMQKYLEEAKRSLAEAGGTYTPTKAEQKAADFTAKLPFLSQISFSYGGLFSGGYCKTFHFEDNLRAYYQSYLPFGEIMEVPISYRREEFLDQLIHLHIGQWKKHYDLRQYGMAVLDGYSWELTFHFSNGHRSVTYTGNNAYPYNFGDLLALFESPWLGLGECPDDEEDCSL